MEMGSADRPWRMIQWARPAQRGVSFAIPVADTSSLRAALSFYGSPHVPGASPIQEAEIFLAAAAEVEHALLVEYLYASWSLGSNPLAGRVLEIAIQEMCHLITVQNLRLFAGFPPHFKRQDQDPSPELDPFRFTLRPFSKSVLEDFLLAEMPSLQDMTAEQAQVMKPIIAAHEQLGQSVHPVGLIYARLYWLFQKDDAATADWPEVASSGFTPGCHIDAFPGQGTVTTFQVDRDQEPAWQGQHDHDGIFEKVDSRETALKTIAAIASQGEGLVGASGQQSHFASFLEIYNSTDFSSLAMLKWPTDPFVADQAAPDPAVEANRITHKLAAALCGVFDARYRIMLASIRAALSRDRTNAQDAVVRDKYAKWALQEMLGPIKALAGAIAKLPCKEGASATGLTAAPTFNLADLDLPNDATALDDTLLRLHRSAAAAIVAALAQSPDAGTKFRLQQLQQSDHTRFPNL